MTITRLTSEVLEHLCDQCNARRELSLRALRLGPPSGTPGRLLVVALPSCECGSIEHLFPSSSEHRAPGSFGHLHGLLVTVLVARLIDRGAVGDHIDVSALDYAAPKQSTLQRWFPNGLRLDARDDHRLVDRP